MIKFGPAGTGIDSINGLKKIAKLGLEAVEIEFTYGVRMSIAKAKELGKLAKELNIDLSIHAPFYVNLASLEPEKVEASKKRIIDSCERGHHMGATHIVFHAAFYQKREPEEIYQIVKKEIIDLQKTIKKNKWNVHLAPETTGKGSQFGSLDELLRLSKETGCSLTVDFAHLRARNNGKIDYEEVFSKLKKVKHIHAHFSGIEFTEKGERKHLITDKKIFMPFLKELKKVKPDITIINESPTPIDDALKGKKLFLAL